MGTEILGEFKMSVSDHEVFCDHKKYVKLIAQQMVNNEMSFL